VGNQVTPFGLEGQIASDQTTFLERSLSRALTPSLLAGVSAGREFTSGSLDFGVFGDAFDRDPARRADGFGLVARSTRELLDFAPRSALAGQVHFGSSMERRELDSDARLRIRSRPESGLADRRLVDTRTIDGADSLSGLGVELAVDVGPAALQAEWVGQRVDRPGDDAELHGGYVQFSVFATGERRRYDPRRGLFRAVEPSSSHGALELAARYSWLDLTDEPVTGGEQADVTLGASWYLDRNWRLSLEWIEAAARPDRDGIDVDLTIVQLRLQVDF
jgi:phosphate-selective porin OprO/OprP